MVILAEYYHLPLIFVSKCRPFDLISNGNEFKQSAVGVFLFFGWLLPLGVVTAKLVRIAGRSHILSGISQVAGEKQPHR